MYRIIVTVCLINIAFDMKKGVSFYQEKHGTGANERTE